MTTLKPAALAAVERAVRAIVEHDEDQLAAIAPDEGDLYVWTREYGSNGVHLVMPPGDPSEWAVDVTDIATGGQYVAVEMWTREEGRSDLTLELKISEVHGQDSRVRVLDLHVL